jgi:hypothetical protein
MAALVCAAVSLNAQQPAINPFAVNDGLIPPKSEYAGPLFPFHYDYPKAYKTPAMPWREVLKGKPLTN